MSIFPLKPIHWRLAGLAPLVLLAGCATYRAQPLPERSDLATAITAALVNPALDLPPLRHQRYSPDQGLNETEVAMLAVVNNPDLKTKRKKRGIARAQLFDAHLFPDPQFSLSIDHPTSGGANLSNGHSMGLGYDLMALVSHNAKVASADAHRHSIDLSLLWQEWQVAERARLLYHKLQARHQQVALLRKNAYERKQHYDDARHQLKRGNITLEQLSAELTGYADVQSQLYKARLKLTDSRHKLNALLGLAPSLKLKLRSRGPAVPDLPQPLPANASELVPHRPDLLALKAGYQSQEASVRKAILEQFPAISLNVNQASDTSDVHTLGLGLQLKLPLWNANRGQIAVERATRSKLRQAYQARIDQTMGDIDRLRRRFSLIRGQYQQVNETLPTLRKVQQAAHQAYQAGNFNSLSYLNIEDSLLKKESEAIDLRVALWKARVSLETLLGWPMDGSESPGAGTDRKERTPS